MTVAFAYAPSLLPGSPSALHPGLPPSTRSSHFRWVPSPPLPRYPQVGLVQQTPVLARVLGPERGRGSQGTERGWGGARGVQGSWVPPFPHGSRAMVGPHTGQSGRGGEQAVVGLGCEATGSPEISGPGTPWLENLSSRAPGSGQQRTPRPASHGLHASPGLCLPEPGVEGTLLGGPQMLWAPGHCPAQWASRRPQLRATGGLSRLCLSGGVTEEMAGGPPPHTRRSACFFPHRLSGPKPAPHRPGCPRRFCRRLVACRELG